MSNPDPPRATPLRRSLRAKGWLGTLALLLYVLGAGLYVASERDSIDRSIRQLEQVSAHEKALALAEAGVNGALLDVSTLGPTPAPSAEVPLEIRLYMENCDKLFADLEPFDPGYARLQRTIARSYQALQAQNSRASWLDLRESLSRVSADLDIRHQSLLEHKEALAAAYRHHYDAVTVETLGLAIVGLAAFGSLAAWFFSGLANDVRRLEVHAWRVVRGTRGVHLRVDRRDELGQLMHAVNRMAIDLDEREKQIELDAERRSHQDKMMTVAAVAAGVAHEVNNPLAVIGGLAQQLQAAGGLPPEQLAATTGQILAQVDRAARASRQLAEVVAPQPQELDWVDLNALVRRAVQLMGYDRRYRWIRFLLALDDKLPAVRTSAHAVQVVLMQLLTTGCDALPGTPGTGLEVRVGTGRGGDGVRVAIDWPAALDLESAESGRGLMLARATLEGIGVRLAVEQGGTGPTRVQFTLPDTAGEST